MHFWLHCVKTVQIQGYLWSIFSCIWTEYRKIRTRNNSVFGHFSRGSFAHNFQEDQLYRTLLGNIFSIAASCTFWKVFQIFYIFCMGTNAWQFESKINCLHMIFILDVNIFRFNKHMLHCFNAIRYRGDWFFWQILLRKWNFHRIPKIY